MHGILIASSEAATRHTLRVICEQSDFRAVEATTGHECIQIIEQDHLDLVLMSFDLDEPAPQTTCYRIQSMTTAPVILLAKYDEVESALTVGASDVIEWPSHPRLLIQRLYSILQYQQAAVGATGAGTRAHEQQLASEALRESAATLKSSVEFETVLDQILDSIQRVIPNDMSTMFLLDEEGRKAHCVRTLDNTGRGLAESLKTLMVPINEIPHLNDMAVTGEPLLIPDTERFETWVNMPPTDWVRSVVSAPIQVDEGVIGFIFVNAAAANAFTPSQCEMLRVFAKQAGIAIRNARLYEATEQYARTLEAHVNERTTELQRERAELKAVLDSIGEGVQSIVYAEDLQTRLHSFINPALYDLLGYDVDELNRMLDTYPGEGSPNQYSDIQAKLHDKVKESGMWKGEARLRRKDGEMVDAGLTVTRLNRADGRMMGVVTIFRDLRREKQLDNQKKRFVASAAHELRNPIGALKARLYLLRKQPERLDYHTKVMERINAQLENLVEELLDLSRFENGLIRLKSAVIEVVSFVHDSVLLLEAEAEDKGVRLVQQLAEPPLYVSIDATRMLQVMSNLLTNAIKFTPEEGIVTIEVRKGRTASPEEGYVLLSIEDTGPGIEGQYLPHIFEPFYRVRDGGRGMGLGLAIIKEIVELHEGQITVTSTVGKGTCFTVWLKLLDRVNYA